MIHYKDRTYCNAGVLCKSIDCDRRIAMHDVAEARKLGLPVCYIAFTKAKCFMPWFAPDKKQKRLTKDTE